MAHDNTLAPKVIEEFHHHWWTVLLEGFVLVLLGAIAIVLPFMAGIVVTVVVGWLLVMAGLMGLWTSWSMRKVRGTNWAVVSSLLAIVAGVAFFAWPVGGLISLTIILGAYLTIDGITTITLALQHRKAKTANWGWLLFNGILDLTLATWILILQPGIDAWILGLIVGIDLIFAGFSMIAMGWSAKQHVLKITT